MNGFSMAGKCKKSYPNIVLIFVFPMESLVFQSYEYDTFCLCKSALDNRFEKQLISIFARIVYNELYYVVKCTKSIIKTFWYIECNVSILS